MDTFFLDIDAMGSFVCAFDCVCVRLTPNFKPFFLQFRPGSIFCCLWTKNKESIISLSKM